MANNTIGSIPYSLSLRSSNPLNEDAAKKIYATAQSRETVTLKMLAAHIREHGSSFSVGTLYGVLADMVSCTLELLKSGYSVNFDGLAKFYVTLSSNGADSTAEFTTANIKKVNILSDVDDAATSELNTETEFEYVGTRAEQAAAKAAAKAAMDTELGVTTTTDDSGSGNSGSGSGSVEE